MNAKRLDSHVTEFIPKDKTDFYSVRNLTLAMFKLNEGTLFSSRTASQFLREQFRIYVDYHVMVEVLESLTRLDVLDYDHVGRDGCEVYILKIK